MIRGFNPWDPKEYSKWYHYLWLMPLLTPYFAYVWIDNRIYGLWNKSKS